MTEQGLKKSSGVYWGLESDACSLQQLNHVVGMLRLPDRVTALANMAKLPEFRFYLGAEIRDCSIRLSVFCLSEDYCISRSLNSI